MYCTYLEIVERSKVTPLLSNESKEPCAAKLVERVNRLVPVETVYGRQTGINVVAVGAIGTGTLAEVARWERCRQVVCRFSTGRVGRLRETDVHKYGGVVGIIHGDLSVTKEVGRLAWGVANNDDGREPRHDQVGYAGDEDC